MRANTNRKSPAIVIEDDEYDGELIFLCEGPANRQPVPLAGRGTTTNRRRLPIEGDDLAARRPKEQEESLRIAKAQDAQAEVEKQMEREDLEEVSSIPVYTVAQDKKAVIAQRNKFIKEIEAERDPIQDIRTTDEDRVTFKKMAKDRVRRLAEAKGKKGEKIVWPEGFPYQTVDENLHIRLRQPARGKRRTPAVVDPDGLDFDSEMIENPDGNRDAGSWGLV